MDLLSRAEEILKKDILRNYCVLEMMKGAQCYDVDILNESVFIRRMDGGLTVMLSAPSKEDGEALIQRNVRDDDGFFYTVGSWPKLVQGRKVKVHNQCDQLYLPVTVEIQDDEEGIIPLTADMAPYIHENYEYKHIMSVDYIRERILKGHAFGVMDNGILAGWAMTHEEGTMGILTVLPSFRRKGYAKKVTAALVKSLRAQGNPCIVHIVKGNTPSLTLSYKNGMVYDCDVEWIILDQTTIKTPE